MAPRESARAYLSEIGSEKPPRGTESGAEGAATGENRSRVDDAERAVGARFAPLPAASATSAAETSPRRSRRTGPFSSLSLRILAINVLALAILLGGLLYLDQYRDGLIEAKTAALKSEAEIFAGALGQSAITGPSGAQELDPERAQQLLVRLIPLTRTRARVFGLDGALLIDSRELVAAGREVQTAALPPPSMGNRAIEIVGDAFDWLLQYLPRYRRLPLYIEAVDQRAEDYDETAAALRGEAASALRVMGDSMVISVAVPIQHFKRVLGALMVSVDDADIQESVREVRLAIVQVFLLALAITVLLSLFLGGTIVRPLRRLAVAAEKVRRGHGRRVAIPDMTDRHDEIGELSGALSDMTNALYRRLDAIEAFAADVAHEIKNPLTSLRSAVEALPRVRSAEQQAKLMQIVQDDVSRLNRLITDISEASRLDAELWRAETAPVDIRRLLETTVEVYSATGKPGTPEFELITQAHAPLIVPGLEDRLGQVFRNLLDNAISFNPPTGVIRIAAHRDAHEVLVVVDDQGPGIPEERAEAMFDRFYTLRPENEAFGTHSGLGLSISRQIVEAHGGTISAENRRDASGRIEGARFLVRLPI